MSVESILLKKEKKPTVLKCPHCDYEYLPGEIFIPNYVIGQPTEIERSVDGKIMVFDDLHQSNEEVFTCIKCNKTFNARANVTYETWVAQKFDFDNEYKSTVYTDRIYLKEE